MTHSTQKGTDYEHFLSNKVYEVTDGDLVPLGAGYNSATGLDVDMIIDDGEAVHVFELKRTSKDGYTLHWTEDDRQKDDLYGLCKFCVQYPRPAYPYAGVRFNNRQLCLTRLFIENWPEMDELLDSAVTLDPSDGCVSRTYKDNLRFRKDRFGPDWPSQGLDEKDAQHVLDQISYVL